VFVFVFVFATRERVIKVIKVIKVESFAQQ